MIYTVTFNPAVDHVIHTGDIIPGKVNRSVSEQVFFGGKGINVSLVLKELGVKSKALGFAAGFTGDAIVAYLSENGIENDFVRLKKGFSRINVKIKAGTETEINSSGPDISAEELELLLEKLDTLTEGDILVLAGSIPPSLPSDTYEMILRRLSGKGILFAVDATKELLLNVLKYRPFLIKPNNFELEEIFGVPMKTDADIEKYARKLHEMGAENVLVSMAENGAMLIDSTDKLYRCGVCRGTPVNSVGAGDSMLAGFIAGSLDNDSEYALRLGTAAGGATVFSPGLASAESITRLLNTI